ncbi:hypothetical protein [Streptomyces sp. NPDC001422]|uniref:hypothetical protein n=1 Tax=Streptomyces sp. NPDC001422 TaxID=3364575 RepID=UPI0036864EF4
MDESELRKRERDLESLLWDLVDDPDEGDVNGYQSSAIPKVAALLAGYEQRIAELEAKLAERTNPA